MKKGELDVLEAFGGGFQFCPGAGHHTASSFKGSPPLVEGPHLFRTRFGTNPFPFCSRPYRHGLQFSGRAIGLEVAFQLAVPRAMELLWDLLPGFFGFCLVFCPVVPVPQGLRMELR